MRKLTALVAATTLALSALPAAAGVVITQKQHVTSGTNARDSEQTVSVEGNKQKMVTERHTIITDLDIGKMYVLDPKTKTYFQLDFPPKGQMAAMMAASTNAAMNFKKAGTTREIAGYKCTDYDGGGHMMAGDYKINIPGMPPEQAEKINEMMAKRPPVVTSTLVEKIETKKLADADFTVPADFTKRDLPKPGMMKMGQMKAAPAPAAGASPAQ
jgi:hypothetical protein